MNDSESEQLRLISNSILKAVFLVCVCTMFGVTLHTCKVDTEKIQICNEECQQGAGHMRSVTAYECECGTNNTTPSSPWVIP
jgi:hypothetical protein